MMIYNRYPRDEAQSKVAKPPGVGERLIGDRITTLKAQVYHCIHMHPVGFQ